jgi:hypothetical protein
MDTIFSPQVLHRQASTLLRMTVTAEPTEKSERAHPHCREGW